MKKSVIINIIVVFLAALSMTASADNLLKGKSGIQYKDLKTGDGAEAVPEKIVTVSLTIWADAKGAKGKRFFDSHETGSGTISFKLGTDKMPDGLNIGIEGMRVGGMRRLHIPRNLNPKDGSGKFPGNAALIYEVELLEVK